MGARRGGNAGSSEVSDDVVSGDGEQRLPGPLEHSAQHVHPLTDALLGGAGSELVADPEVDVGIVVHVVSSSRCFSGD
ncbi:hypothetical protein ABE10_13220 [Bacillus toyonensis]|nr:hypothetical protein [Bacillus toyonensis]